jgi:hypothetical protein
LGVAIYTHLMDASSPGAQMLCCSEHHHTDDESVHGSGVLQGDERATKGRRAASAAETESTQAEVIDTHSGRPILKGWKNSVFIEG